MNYQLSESLYVGILCHTTSPHRLVKQSGMLQESIIIVGNSYYLQHLFRHTTQAATTATAILVSYYYEVESWYQQLTVKIDAHMDSLDIITNLPESFVKFTSYRMKSLTPSSTSKRGRQWPRIHDELSHLGQFQLISYHISFTNVNWIFPS